MAWCCSAVLLLFTSLSTGIPPDGSSRAYTWRPDGWAGGRAVAVAPSWAAAPSLVGIRAGLRGGGGAVEEKIAAIELEMRRTQRNKATEAHLGQLKSRLSALRKQRMDPATTSVQKEGLDLAHLDPDVRDAETIAGDKLSGIALSPAPDAGVVADSDELSQYTVSDSGKARMSLLDLMVEARLLRRSLVGMRLSNIYDFDAKTFVLKLGGRSWWSPEGNNSATGPSQHEASSASEETADGDHSEVSDHAGSVGAEACRSTSAVYIPREGGPAMEQGEAVEGAEAIEGGEARVALAADALHSAALGDSRRVLLVIQSGVRIHTTKYTHAAPPEPCGFVVKLRKHLRNQRLMDLRVVRGDRILCLTFASSNRTHHLLVEFYAGIAIRTQESSRKEKG